MKRLAAREGMPYQTLMSSILHKFATGRLIDKDSALELIARRLMPHKSRPKAKKAG